MTEREKIIAEIDRLTCEVLALRRRSELVNLPAADDLEEAGEFLDDARLSLLAQGLTDR